MEHQHSKSQILRHTLIKLGFSFLTLLLFSCSSIRAQNYTINNGKAIKLFEKAQELYQASKLNQAEEVLLQALEKESNFVEASTLLGYVYLDLGDYAKSKQRFEKATVINPKAIPSNFFFLAELEIRDGEYELAKKHYQQFLSLGQANPQMQAKTNIGLHNIEFALAAKANPFQFKPQNLGPNINTEHEEYFPCITVDQKTFLFTRRLPFKEAPLGYQEDFFVAELENEEWSTAYNINRPINTEFNEGAPTLSPDGQILIFTACELYGNYGAGRRGNGSCDLFYAAKNGRNWSTPINIGPTINTRHWETQPSFSADGRTLYFVRGINDRSGVRQGDIYTSSLTSDNYWTKPIKLNRNINTLLNEESVFIHPDGRTLYFSSDGHKGMGGLDIFMSKKGADGEWGPAINLGYPINSHNDENSLLVAADGKTAYFASDREEGYGGLDLYSFELPEEFAPEKVTYFAGKIFDSKTNKPLNAKFELIDLESGELMVESFSNSEGNFLVTLPGGKDYALNASKDGYLFYSENIALKNSDAEQAVQKDVALQAIELGQKIILNNIFFETAKFNLKENSIVELEKLHGFMQKNPTLNIEVAGHTDNVGDANSNLNLSKNRATTVVDYLVKKGIPASRIRSKGYGASKPIADNSTKEGRAKNRRTEIEIVEI